MVLKLRNALEELDLGGKKTEIMALADRAFQKENELIAETQELQDEVSTLQSLLNDREEEAEANLPNENLYDTQKNEVLKRMHRNLTLEELNTLEAEAKMLMRNGRQYAY